METAAALAAVICYFAVVLTAIGFVLGTVLAVAVVTFQEVKRRISRK